MMIGLSTQCSGARYGEPGKGRLPQCTLRGETSLGLGAFPSLQAASQGNDEGGQRRAAKRRRAAPPPNGVCGCAFLRAGRETTKVHPGWIKAASRQQEPTKFAG